MGLKIDTEKLQGMVSKAIACSSNNKLIPITSLMCVQVNNNWLTLMTTDATNYYYVSTDGVECEDFEVSVIAETFTKLVQKTSAKTTEIYLDENSLVVKGNGTYHLELPLDDGHPIKFPNKIPNENMMDLGTIKKSAIDMILTYNKPSLAVGVEYPALTTYYCGDKVITSDQVKICSTDIKLWEEPKLITSQLMEVLNTMTEDDISIQSNNECLVFTSGHDKVYAPITEGVDTFPIDAISNLVNSEFNATCKISRMAVIDLLDRLTLFVSKYDNKGIRLTFTTDGVMFSSKKSNGVEIIPYIENDGNCTDYTCFIDVEYLKSQITTQNGETLTISYGSDVAIKLTSNDVVQIVALMED